MPCMGPHHNKEMTKELYELLLATIKNKYPAFLSDFVTFRVWLDERERVLKNFYKAVDDLVWQDECEGF